MIFRTASPAPRLLAAGASVPLILILVLAAHPAAADGPQRTATCGDCDITYTFKDRVLTRAVDCSGGAYCWEIPGYEQKCRNMHSSTQSGVESVAADSGTATIEDCVQPNPPDPAMCSGELASCEITYLEVSALQPVVAGSTATSSVLDELGTPLVTAECTWTGIEIVYTVFSGPGSEPFVIDWPGTPLAGVVVEPGEAVTASAPQPIAPITDSVPVALSDPDSGDVSIVFEATTYLPYLPDVFSDLSVLDIAIEPSDAGLYGVTVLTSVGPWITDPTQPVVLRVTEHRLDGTSRVVAQRNIPTAGTGGALCCEGDGPCACPRPEQVPDCRASCPPEAMSELPDLCYCNEANVFGGLSLAAGSTLSATINPDGTHTETADPLLANNELLASVPSSWNRAVTGIAVTPDGLGAWSVGFSASVHTMLIDGEEVDLSSSYTLLVNGNEVALAPVRSLTMVGTGTCAGSDSPSCPGSCPPIHWDGENFAGQCASRNSQCGCKYDRDKCCLTESIDLLSGDELMVCVAAADAAGPEPFTGDDCFLFVHCPADVVQDGLVNVDDLIAVITTWGPCAPPCPTDIDGNGTVNVDDLVQVIIGWGSCGG